MIKVCEYCKKEYEQTNNNQKYCCKQCCSRAYTMRRKRPRKSLTRRDGLPDGYKKPLVEMPTIECVMRLAKELTEKTGRFHQYGDVQKMFLAGELKVKDGAIV